MKLNINRRELFVPLIENAIKKCTKDRSLNEFLKGHRKEAYKQVLILSVYDEIQGTIDGTNLLNVTKHGDRDDLIKLLWEQHRTIQILETELYNIKNGGQDEIYNAFYGNISNEKIELLELIEEFVK